MKNYTRKFLLCLLTSAFTALAHGASVSVYDSVVSLAMTGTKNYTFTDPVTAQKVVITVTMSPVSPFNASPVFSALDGDTRVGVDSHNGLMNGMGVNFSATLVSASSGVAADSVKFRIAALGIRPADGGGSLTWTSSVTSFNVAYADTTEIIQPLDPTNSALNYTSQLRFPSDAIFQLTDVPAPGQSIVFNTTFTVANNVDPRTNTWFTTYSGKYARIYTSDANRTNGAAVTTWSKSTTIQSVPAYCGIQEIYASSNWVYIRSTGLGSHVMGAWYNNAAHSQPFVAYPTNQKALYRLPRNPALPATQTQNKGGAIGYFVDGVAMFNSWDAQYWNGTTEVSSTGNSGYWNRDAYVNEGATFDPANAHQPGSGQYHYHANPPALRYFLGDHVDFNATSKIFTEATNLPTKHSPILGWVADGYPIYGPYGYASASNSASGIRRMISGYVPRNGQFGTSNLVANGRTTIPIWAARLYNVASNILSGPAVSTTYPLGHYMEDNDYLGDHGYTQGVDFDLDEHNGRWCITPEFPNGTYAYFTAIAADGTPVFPYNIGFAYKGNPTGGTVTSITDTVTTNFLGNTNLVPALNPPAVKNGVVTLTWSALEGGTYRVESTTNLSAWTTNATGISAGENNAGYTNNTPENRRFFRVVRTGVASFDNAGTTTILNVSAYTVAPGGTASRGTTVQVTITLPTTPPWPQAGAPITSVTLGGSITAQSVTDTVQGTVVAIFTIPAGAATGAQNIVVTFSNGPTYTLAGGITIN